MFRKLELALASIKSIKNNACAIESILFYYQIKQQFVIMINKNSIKNIIGICMFG